MFSFLKGKVCFRGDGGVSGMEVFVERFFYNMYIIYILYIIYYIYYRSKKQQVKKGSQEIPLQAVGGGFFSGGFFSVGGDSVRSVGKQTKTLFLSPVALLIKKKRKRGSREQRKEAGT